MVFADAAASGPEPFALALVNPIPPRSINTHALSPGDCLRVYRQVVGVTEPKCYVLGIRGYAFDLGADLSVAAAANLEAALAYLLDWLPKVLQPPGVE